MKYFSHITELEITEKLRPLSLISRSINNISPETFFRIYFFIFYNYKIVLTDSTIIIIC